MLQYKNYKSFLIVMVILGILVFVISGCGSSGDVQLEKPVDKVSEENQSEEGESKDITVPTADVPGTNISLYPGAELVYGDDRIIVYVTNASVDDLFKFYKDFPQLKTLHISKTGESFGLETELIRIVRNQPRIKVEDAAWESAMNAYKKEIADEISKSGRLIHVMGLRADSEEVIRVFNEDIISQLPRDMNILWFMFWDADL